MYLDPTMRASWDDVEGTFTFNSCFAADTTDEHASSVGDVSVGDAEDAYTGFYRSRGRMVAATTSAKRVDDVVIPRSTSSRVKPLQQPSSSSATPAVPLTTKLQVTMSEVAEGLRGGSDKGIGLDVEPISTFVGKSDDFLARNFTDAELQYCLKRQIQMYHIRT